MMKTAIMKTISAVLALVMLFTACSKSKKDDTPTPNVAKEITAEELVNYMIIEEYAPKVEYAAIIGTKPVLIYTYFEHQSGNSYLTKSGDAQYLYYILETELSYSSETGITTLKTAFGNYELSRDDNKQIIVKKSNHNVDLAYAISLDFTSSYIQLVKRYSSAFIFYLQPYKEISGTGYYAFTQNKWRYKQGSLPITSEYTWDYTALTNQIWHGQDGGTAQYYNLFLILPQGNGWKGQHKDKDLLIVNTLDKDSFQAVGDIGIYTVNN